MAVSVSDVKEYMHAEGVADATVSAYMAMAVNYLVGAGVVEANSPADTYGLAVKALTLHYYDNRGGAELPAGLDAIITQLQYRQVEPDDEDEDDTEDSDADA